MIGIVVLNYQNYEVTQNCVSSILMNPPNEDYRIYIIDNGSNNESYSVLQARYQDNTNIRVDRLEENVGFASGNDYGLLCCEKDGVKECILSNSDILFSEGSIDGIIDVIRKNENAVIVGPCIHWGGMMDRIMHSSRLAKPRIIDPLEIGRFFPLKKLDEERETGVHKVYSVSGCCFGVSIERFRDMGAFDKSTFLYNEENILGAQAEKSGYSTLIDLDKYVIHYHAQSSGKENDFVRSEYIKSTIYFWKQYRGANRIMLRLILIMFTIKLRIQHHEGIHPKEIYRIGNSYLNSLYTKG